MRKTIIITGAGSGIGAATTKAFLDDGYQVGLIGRRSKTLEAVANGHENALILPCDVADPAAVENAFANAMAEEMFGEFGVATLDYDDLARVIDIKKADKLSKKYGENSFMSLTEIVPVVVNLAIIHLLVF